jgi:hypothetical protein
MVYGQGENLVLFFEFDLAIYPVLNNCSSYTPILAMMQHVKRPTVPGKRKITRLEQLFNTTCLLPLTAYFLAVCFFFFAAALLTPPTFSFFFFAAAGPVPSSLSSSSSSLSSSFCAARFQGVVTDRCLAAGAS